jgi:integrase
MAFAFSKNGRWYAGWKDASGRKRRQLTTAATKSEARRIADDLERRAERERLGIEAAPAPQMTFNALADYWLEHHSSVHCRSHDGNVARLKLHLRPVLGSLTLGQVTPRRLEELFAHKLRAPRPGAKATRQLGAQSIAHLRALVRKMFNDARRWGMWRGENPATLVPAPQIVRRPPVFADAKDIPHLLDAASEPFRTLFAIGIYAGLREGEILALRRPDVDLGRGLILVTCTLGRDTTKGGRFRVVPIPDELAPFLNGHLDRSGDEYLFPELRALKAPKTRVLYELRRTLVVAGLVVGYDHICRRKSCRQVERHDDLTPRDCQKCGMRLWVKGVPKPLNVHALRHTYVSQLLMAGANPEAVRRMAGHANLKTTLDTYGHLTPDYLKAEAARLKFGVSNGDQPSAPEPTAKAARRSLLGPRRSRGRLGAKRPSFATRSITQKIGNDPEGIRTPTSGVRGQRPNH